MLLGAHFGKVVLLAWFYKNIGFSKRSINHGHILQFHLVVGRQHDLDYVCFSGATTSVLICFPDWFSSLWSFSTIFLVRDRLTVDCGPIQFSKQNKKTLYKTKKTLRYQFIMKSQRYQIPCNPTFHHDTVEKKTPPSLPHP